MSGFKNLNRKATIVDGKLPLTVNVGQKGEGLVRGMNKNISEIKNVVGQYPVEVTADQDSRHVVFSISPEYLRDSQAMLDNLNARCRLLNQINTQLEINFNQGIEDLYTKLTEHNNSIENQLTDYCEMNRNNIQDLQEKSAQLGEGLSESCGLIADLAKNAADDFKLVKGVRKMVWWLCGFVFIQFLAISYLSYQLIGDKL